MRTSGWVACLGWALTACGGSDEGVEQRASSGMGGAPGRDDATAADGQPSSSDDDAVSRPEPTSDDVAALQPEPLPDDGIDAAVTSNPIPDDTAPRGMPTDVPDAATPADPPSAEPEVVPTVDEPMPEPTSALAACELDSDCDDGVDCTVDQCYRGLCVANEGHLGCAPGELCHLFMGCIASKPCGTDEECADDDGCTENERCIPETRTCVYSILDGDGDHSPPLVCGGIDCNDAIWQIPAPLDLACNEVDDDCDGEVDEDLTVMDDPQNCGECGNACGSDVCTDGLCEPGPAGPVVAPGDPVDPVSTPTDTPTPVAPAPTSIPAPTSMAPPSPMAGPTSATP